MIMSLIMRTALIVIMTATGFVIMTVAGTMVVTGIVILTVITNVIMNAEAASGRRRTQRGVVSVR
ncbi:hypothetical protein ABN034_05420 [Actinopolymorpha sp. B11F2]|uniref:hypothetical protein n=1 Tax=Actinopolymorpha sp. B11F2 TaxID=3160862 RepID=UPI0032E4A131